MRITRTLTAALFILCAVILCAVETEAQRKAAASTQVQYMANGGTLDITGKSVRAADIKDLKIVMPIPADIRQRIAARTLRNVIFEVRIYDGQQQFSTLEGRVEFEKNLGALAGKTSLTVWLQKPDGTSDFTFNYGVGEREQFGGDPNRQPVAFQAERMRTLKAGSNLFKIKARIMPYWVVRTPFGPEEKGAPFYYPNETVPQLTID